jgi:hypothetical protein
MTSVLGRAPINLFNEKARAGNDFGTWAAQQLSKVEGFLPPSLRGFAGIFKGETDPMQIPQFFGEPTTFLGGMAEGVTRFALDMATMSRTLPTGPLTTLKGYVGFAGKAALVDATAFDPYEERLANLMDQYGPEFAQPVVQFMMSGEDDSWAEARVKAALEGFVIGGTIDLFVVGLRGLRGARAVKASAEFVGPPRPGVGEAVVAGDEALLGGVGGQADQAAQVAKRESERIAQGARELEEAAAKAQRGLRGAPKMPLEQLNSVGGGVVEMAMKDARKPSGKLSVDQLKMIGEDVERIHAMDLPPDRVLDEYGHVLWNNKYVDSPANQKAMMLALAEQFRSRLPETHAARARRADDILTLQNGEETMLQIQSSFGELDDALLEAGHNLAINQGAAVDRLSRIVADSPTNRVAREQWVGAIQSQYGVMEILTNANSRLGRGMNVLATLKGRRGTGQMLPTLPNVFDDMTDADAGAMARRIINANKDPGKQIGEIRASIELERIRKVDDMSVWERGMRRIVAYRIQNLLSGPRTHMVNSTSNFVVSMMRPMEMMWAGGFSGNTKLMHQGWDIMVGNFKFWQESMEAARIALNSGESILDPKHTFDDRNIKLGITGREQVDEFLELPGRLLLSEDEFFKQKQYRSFVRSRSLRQSREALDGGKRLSPAAVAERLDADMRAAFDIDGKGIDQEAPQYARVSTFTNDLGKGTPGQYMQGFFNEHPLFKIVVPFWRTPVNLTRYVGQRTPLVAKLGRQWRIDMAAGGERAAIARAKHQMGTTIYAGAAILAYNGMITGGGPQNQALRQQWLQTHKPYSVYVPTVGRWISFRRLDPVMAPFGLVADAIYMMGELPEVEQGRVAATVISSIMANIGDKTYLASLTRMVSTLFGGSPGAITRTMNELVLSTAIPFSAMARQMGQGLDPYYRETSNFLDEIANRLPGFSLFLEPTRNLLGEPILRSPGAGPAATEPPGGQARQLIDAIGRFINPFEVRGIVNDPVADELILFRRGIGMPERHVAVGRRNEIDLRDGTRYHERGGQTPYDRMVELVGTTELLGRQTLREALEEEVRSDYYQNSPPASVAAPDGERFVLLRDIVNEYYAEALDQIKFEYPSLQKDYDFVEDLREAGIEGEEAMQLIREEYGR